MPGAIHTDSTPVPAMPNPAHRYLVFAWIAVALIPVMLVLGMVIGEGLQALQGYTSGDEDRMPLGAELLAAVPAIIVLLLPTLPAIVYGLRARRLGSNSGIVPAIIGIAYAAWTLFTNILGLVIGRV